MTNVNVPALRLRELRAVGLCVLCLGVACNPGSPEPAERDQSVAASALVDGADNPLDIASLGLLLLSNQEACPIDVTAFDPSGRPVPAHTAVGAAVVDVRPDLVVGAGGVVSRLSNEAWFGSLKVGDYLLCSYVLDAARTVIPECSVGAGRGHLSPRSKLPLKANPVCYPPGTQGVNGSGNIFYAPYFNLTRLREEVCAGGKATLTGQVVSLSHDPQLSWRISHVTVDPPGATPTWSVADPTQWQPAPGGAVTLSASLDVPGTISFRIDTKDSRVQGQSFSLDFVFYESGLARFVVPAPGIQSSVWSDGTVSLAVPLKNDSEQLAADVHLTSIEVPGAALLAPPLPQALGDFVPDAVRKIDARLKVPQYGQGYPLRVSGTYAVGEDTCNFHAAGQFVPQPRDQKPVVALSSKLPKLTLQTASFPAFPVTQFVEREFNADGLLPPLGQPRLNQSFLNPPGSRIPFHTPLLRAPFRIDPPPPEQPVQFDCPAEDPGDKVFFTRNTVADTYGGFPPDPTVAGNIASTCLTRPCALDDVTMVAANTAVTYSVDSGLTFTTVSLGGLVDPAIPGRNSFFPQDDGGLCCDMVLTYVPSARLFVWLLQYWPQQIGTDSAGNPVTSTNRLRIAWASPEGIRADFLHAWTWVDLTSGGVGIGNDWMDFPDMTYSDGYVYVGVDHAISNTGSVYTGRHIYARLSLPDIVDVTKPYVTYWYMDPSRGGLFQNHIVQTSRDAFYFLAMPDTSTLTVYEWPDSSDTATPHDIGISNFDNSDYSAPTPEGIDWNAAPKLVLGATRTDPFCFGCTSKFAYLAFSAGRSGSGRPFPYVRVEKVDLASFSLVNELDIWNPGFAFSTPALVSRENNSQEEVAISLATGGGGNFANNAVGFLGDFVVYTTTDSDTTHAGYARDSSGNIVRDSAGNPTYAVRFGDYYSARNSIGPVTTNGRGVGYSTFAYAAKTAVAGQKCVDVGCSTPLHYVQFGRFRDLCPLPAPPPPK